LKGGYIMAMVKHTAGRELTPEEHAEMEAEIEVAAKRPYTYDPDCPLLTEKQLSEFRPVNFGSMEERARYMKAAGITDPEEPVTAVSDTSET
jgi:hypothetical protein